MLTSRQTQKRRAEKWLQLALKRIRIDFPQSQIPPTTPSPDQIVSNDNDDNSEGVGALNNIKLNDTELVSLSSISDTNSSCKDELHIVEKNISKSWQLGKWATGFNINHNALSPLLGLLRDWLPLEGFPKDPRTLLKTDRNIRAVEIEGGLFHHFGLTSQIIKIVQRVKLSKTRSPIFRDIKNLISIKVGVDGLPISKSSNQQFWPILGKIDQDPSSTIFVISLFYGSQKPQSIESFLHPFVTEMQGLEAHGLEIGNINYVIRISCITADAPARSFLKQINAHNAYFGCERCYRRGTYKNSRILYPIKKECDLYTDQSFKERWYESHHKSINPSPLEILSIGMISQIPLDYMHLCLLGTMKKLLLVWTEGKKPHKLSNLQKSIVSNRIISFGTQIPCNFSRKCRSLQDLRHWKATEFRLFLLYVAPAALRKVLDDKKYQHFLLFHTAIYIFVSNCTKKPDWVAFAQKLLDNFVEQIPKLYYPELMIYNMHSLLHVKLDVESHGSLDNYSAFEFENFMQTIKRMIRSNSSHLSQVIHRVGEIESFSSAVEKTSLRNSGPSTKSGDNVWLTVDKRYCILTNKISDSEFEAKVFKSRLDVEQYPCKSSKLDICILCDIAQEYILISPVSLRRKSLTHN
ncbi:uncharacterized protein LOC118433143 [Folsomia candida]|uniref:uncharacterized protein LOC118433143 n=1 Tax=Folsomia candida TaxID=158441 RepID=UPI0016051547|nr:uncharacterized protein LOC118433143 [Folsomia candida]